MFPTVLNRKLMIGNKGEIMLLYSNVGRNQHVYLHPDFYTHADFHLHVCVKHTASVNTSFTLVLPSDCLSVGYDQFMRVMIRIPIKQYFIRLHVNIVVCLREAPKVKNVSSVNLKKSLV